jgi:hypothetical protein
MPLRVEDATRPRRTRATWNGTAPIARTGHSAVWTGSEMIVWGGNDDATFNTGSRYSPATDTWSPTSVGANVPSARYQHTAIWTGTEMIVWGGQAASRLNTGGRYNPTTDSWAATSTGTDCPTGRIPSPAVWTGTEMLIWGGFVAATVNTGGRYAPATEYMDGNIRRPGHRAGGSQPEHGGVDRIGDDRPGEAGTQAASTSIPGGAIDRRRTRGFPPPFRRANRRGEAHTPPYGRATR